MSPAFEAAMATMVPTVSTAARAPVSVQPMAVEIQSTGEFQAGIPKALFAATVVQGVSRNRYSPSPDGQRFIFVAPLGRDALGPTSVVLNWPGTFRR